MKNTKGFWPIFSKNKLKRIYSRTQTPTSTSITTILPQNEYPNEKLANNTAVSDLLPRIQSYNN